MENQLKDQINQVNLGLVAPGQGNTLGQLLPSRWGWGILAVLISALLFSGGFLAGSLHQLAIYQSQVEELPDINSCQL